MKPPIFFELCRLLKLGILIFPSTIFGQCPDVFPTSDFSMNFCNFPFAWEITKGENVRIGILADNADAELIWTQEIQKLAPGSFITVYSKSDFLDQQLRDNEFQVAVVRDPIKPDEYEGFISALDNYTNISVVLPAYFGSMDAKIDYSEWQTFINLSSERGAIIAGSHGDMYQLGNITFWEKVNVDVFAVMGGKIDGFSAMAVDYNIQENLEESSCLVAGALALLRSRYPDYSNDMFKRILAEKGRRVHWSLIEIPEGESGLRVAIPHFEKEYLGKYDNYEVVKKLKRNIYTASSLDLMLLFDFNCDRFGGWCLESLNIGDAQKTATGKNVTVAILDHGFNKNHTVFQDRIVSPYSFIEGEPAFSDVSDHGTTMAKALIKVAPDVNIMPVVIYGNGHWGDADMYIKGINYAVENGADIISLSHRAIEQYEQERFDEAIQKATAKGVTFVFINYTGERNEVIIPGPVEFAGYDSNPDIIYVIGTNFIDNETPFTWGASQTAPVVSGVIAMMKEMTPDLKPGEIKNILLQSNRTSFEGISLLDADKALKKLSK